MVNAMLALYKPRRSKSIDSSTSAGCERLIPAGVTYITKRKGQLYLARSKHPKRGELASDLLREALAGNKLTTVRTRAKSIQSKPEKTTFLVAGEPYRSPPSLHSQYSDPLPQQAFEHCVPSPQLQSAASPMPSPFPSQNQAQFSNSVSQQQFPSPALSQSQGFAPQAPPYNNMPLIPYPPIHQAPMRHLNSMPPPPMPYPQVPPQYQHYHPRPPQRAMPGYTVFDPNQDTNSNTSNMPDLNATPEALYRLKLVDAHFRKVSVNQSEAKSGDADKAGKVEEASSNSVAADRHVCANCGKLRSRKYHIQNPIKPGVKPTSAFCRKCQKDDTTDSEPEIEDEALKTKKKADVKNKKNDKTKNKSKQPTVESSSEPEEVSKKGPNAKETSKVRAPKEEDLIVEVEFSEDDRSHKGHSLKRGHGQRQNLVGKRYDDYSHQQSSFAVPLNRARSISRDRHGLYEMPNIQLQSGRRREPRQHSTHSRQSSISYRHVPAPQYREPETSREYYPKKVPVTFAGGKGSEKSASRSRSPEARYRAPHLEQSHHDDRQYRQSSVSAAGDDHRNIGPAWKDRISSNTRRSPLRKEYNWEEDVGSADSQQAAESRQQSQWANQTRRSSPWEELHVLNPEPDDEVIVVTETFEYRRPKKTSTMNEEERRRTEDLDRDMLNFRGNTPHLSPGDDASRYYNDDWARQEELAKRREEAEILYEGGWLPEGSPELEQVPGAWPDAGRWNGGVQKKEAGSWRHEVQQDAESDGWSDTESYLNAVKEKRLTRHSPPSFYPPPQPADSYSEPSEFWRRSRRGNVREKDPSSEETVRRPKRESRPPLNREETPPRVSSYTSLIPSPHVSFGEDQVQYFEDRTPSKSTDYEVEEAPSEFSGMTEAERELMRRGERFARRVLLRNEDAGRSGHTAATGESRSGSVRSGHSAGRSERSGRSQKSDEKSFDSQYDSTTGSSRASDVRGGGGGGEWETWGDGGAGASASASASGGW